MAHNRNRECRIRVLPAVHGVKSLDHAKKLASGGLAFVGTTDAGYYGRGIYLSTYANYVTLAGYSGVHPETGDKWLLVCWVVTGNVYPCVELTIGASFAAGHDTHYARVGGNFDEIVVEQEHRILPRYLISLRPDAR